MQKGRLPSEAVILLAEDRQDDVVLIRTAFKKAGISNPLHLVRDGEQALAYLQGHGKFSDRRVHPFPELLLLDLKMPRMDGMEVLAWLKSHPEFKLLRVVVLTSSEDIHDVNKAYQLGANSFLVKPLEFQNYIALARTMARFWLEHSHAPQFMAEDAVASGSQLEH
jgi:CheY-like chemotaxis protein